MIGDLPHVSSRLPIEHIIYTQAIYVHVPLPPPPLPSKQTQVSALPSLFIYL
jgi:hypothetical protein